MMTRQTHAELAIGDLAEKGLQLATVADEQSWRIVSVTSLRDRPVSIRHCSVFDPGRRQFGPGSCEHHPRRSREAAARQPGDFMYMIRFVIGGCPSTVKVTLTMDGCSTSRYRALMAIMPSVVLNRATESSGSETVYRSA